MTISGDSSFPHLFTRIDALTRGDHSYLNDSDACLFLGDYSARKGHAYSATNQLILNFKKPMSRRNKSEWRYKGNAIRQVAEVFSQNIGPDFQRLTLVPVPPSKLKTDPEYDDRLMDMLRALRAPAGITLDIRELIVQTEAIQAAHDNQKRPRPDDLKRIYRIDETLAHPVRDWICVVDDVLTTGSHFRAMSDVLKQRFPAAKIAGLFIARRVPEADDWSHLFSPVDD